MALSANALVDLNTAKAWLPHLVQTAGPASNSLTDEEMERYIEAASQAAERVSRRNLAARNYIDVYSGRGHNELLLMYWPVIAVTGVRIAADGMFDDAVDEPSDSYELADQCGGLIRRRSWPTGYRSIRVSYRAGYELPSVGGVHVVPSDLERAVCEVIDWMRQRDLNQTIGIRTTIGADGLQTSYSLDVPLSARRVFESYQEVRI